MYFNSKKPLSKENYVKMTDIQCIALHINKYRITKVHSYKNAEYTEHVPEVMDILKILQSIKGL